MIYFTYFLGNIEASHPGAAEELLNGSISVSRSFVPSSLCQVDKTIEETIMKHENQASGGKGAGLFGVENNYNVYQRWVRTASERSKFVSKTLNMADMETIEQAAQHRDLRPSRIKKNQRIRFQRQQMP